MLCSGTNVKSKWKSFQLHPLRSLLQRKTPGPFFEENSRLQLLQSTQVWGLTPLFEPVQGLLQVSGLCFLMCWCVLPQPLRALLRAAPVWLFFPNGDRSRCSTSLWGQRGAARTKTLRHRPNGPNRKRLQRAVTASPTWVRHVLPVLQ